MRDIALLGLLLLVIVSCSPVSRTSLNRSLSDTEKTFKDHAGFVVYDPTAKKTVYAYNASTYFTPASNTKIFTLFAGLTILGDSVPAIRYRSTEDSLIFWGTGDPSFLNKNVFQNDRLPSFLRDVDKNLYFSSANFNTTRFGRGWAWDDYNDAYSAERSPFPMYGNVFSINANKNQVVIEPSILSQYMTSGNAGDVPRALRAPDSNNFVYYPGSGNSFKKDIPLYINPELTRQLLMDTLDRDVRLISAPLSTGTKILYSIPVDSLYKVMMQESDNFIAEQILLMCSSVISDTLQPEIAIKYMTTGPLRDLTDKPVWIDGSGLSRYNLFTPRSIVELWEKIYNVVPRERLFAMLAAGGQSGTIRNWYGGEVPYIYGKTGTLSNNHCLSGFLVTRKGKTVIFSFMNSNFTTPTNSVRANMQSILKLIYEKY